MIGGICTHCGKILTYVSDDICEECEIKQPSQCIYCHPITKSYEGENIFNDSDEIEMIIDNEGVMSVSSRIFSSEGLFSSYAEIKINYCPMCGRML